MKTQLDRRLQKSSSYEQFLPIVNDIKSFHHHTHILYDIRSMLDDHEPDDVKVYMEIGSYCGASAALMLQHPKLTHVYCIDPVNLPRKHFDGVDSQMNTLVKNLTKYQGNNMFTVMPDYSTDRDLQLRIIGMGLRVDILFIDGDHSFKGVKSDWNFYHELVKPGGFIVFDDYLDDRYSPEVRPAVDSIVEDIREKRLKYEIIGVLPNYQKAYSGRPRRRLNEFILYKLP